MNAAKTWPRQPLVGVALAAMCGVGIADLADVQSPTAAIVATCIAAVGALAVARSLVTYAFVAVAFFALHTMRINDSPGAQFAKLTGNEPAALSVRGIVVSEPKTSPRGSAIFTLALQTIDTGESVQRTRAHVLARWRNDVHYGDELELFGTAESIPPPRNPGEFDMRAFLAREDITRQFVVHEPANGHVVSHGNGNAIFAAAQRSRAWLRDVLCRGLGDSPDVEAAIVGMSLGIRHETPVDVEEPFQQTGTLHLFAVAGLHVGIIAQLLWILATLARLPRKWAIVLIIPALFFYAAVTGLHTSSVRAAWMSAVLLSGYFVERRVFALNSLAAAALIILCWNTNELFAVGFQLSFAVVGAIILLNGPAFRFLRRFFAPDEFLPRSLLNRRQRILDAAWWWIARALAVSFAAWAGSLVLMFAYYNLVTPISLIANLAVVPIAFCVLAGALISIIAAPFSSWLNLVFNNANWLLARVMLALVHIFAQLPTGHWYLEHPHRPSGAVAELTVLDVGTGGAVHLRTRDDDWMIDCGPRRLFERTTRQYLRSRGVNRLDALLLTHADAAHIGSARDVMDVFVPRVIIDTAARSRSRVEHELTTAIDSSKYQHQTAATGCEWRLSRDVSARVLFPPQGFDASAADDEAIVLQLLVAGRPSALLMSDSGEGTERALLQSDPDLHADVIVKGQHRSGISGTPQFLDAVQPQVIVATSSDLSESERIKDEWAAMISARGIKLLRQDEIGAVRLRFWRNGRCEAQPYLSSEIFRNISR